MDNLEMRVMFTGLLIASLVMVGLWSDWPLHSPYWGLRSDQLL